MRVCLSVCIKTLILTLFLSELKAILTRGFLFVFYLLTLILIMNSSSLFSGTGHAGNITCLFYSPGDPQGMPILVSGSKDGLLKVWDIDNIRRSPYITTLEGHSSWITDVTGSPDGAIFTASNDKSAKIWDYERETVNKPSAFGCSYLH